MRVSWFALLGVMVGCVVPYRDKPEPPDMSALVEAYANPTRALDTDTAAELKELVEAKVRALVDLDRLASLLDDLVGSLRGDTPMARRAGPAPIVLEGAGFARIERICRGHGEVAPPIDKAANGHLELTVGYTERGLDPVVHGGAFACAEQVLDAELAIDGEVRLHIGTNLQLDDLGGSPVLFELAGFAFAVDGREVVSGGFDFQVCRGTASTCVPGHVEVLIGLPSGSTIVLFIDLAGKVGGFRSGRASGSACAWASATATTTSRWPT
jgi:hypothetical protein